MTRIALHPGWTWAMSVAIIVALYIAHRSDVRTRARIGITVAIAITAAAAVVLGLVAAYAPMFQLVGDIAAD